MSDTVATWFRSIADVLEQFEQHPHGPVADKQLAAQAGIACVKFCEGRQDEARTLWKLIVGEVGYMSESAARALVCAADTSNLVPDVEAPVPE